MIGKRTRSAWNRCRFVTENVFFSLLIAFSNKMNYIRNANRFEPLFLFFYYSMLKFKLDLNLMVKFDGKFDENMQTSDGTDTLKSLNRVLFTFRGLLCHFWTFLKFTSLEFKPILSLHTTVFGKVEAYTHTGCYFCQLTSKQARYTQVPPIVCI